MGNFLSATPEGWQERFFELLADTGNVTASAEAVGVSRGTVYYHYYNHEDFKEKFEEARKKCQTQASHAAFRAAYERAIEGWEEPVYQSGELVGYKRKYSDRLLELLLRKLDRETFGDEEPDDKDQHIRIEFVPLADDEEQGDEAAADADDTQ